MSNNSHGIGTNKTISKTNFDFIRAVCLAGVGTDKAGVYRWGIVNQMSNYKSKIRKTDCAGDVIGHFYYVLEFIAFKLNWWTFSLRTITY